MRVIRLACAAAVVMGVCGLAAAQPKPDAPGPVVALPAESVESIARAWERLRNPRILLIAGTARGGQIVYDVPSSAAERLLSPMREQLMRACPNALVAPDIAKIRENEMMDRLRRDVGADLEPGAAKALCELFGADLIVEVTLLPGDRAGQVVPSMQALDTRTATHIASQTLVSVDFSADTRLGHVFGTQLAKTLGEGMVRAAGGEHGARPAETYTLRILTQSGEGGVAERDIRRLAGEIERVRGVSWAESEEAGEGKQRAALIKVRYAGRFRDLIDDVEDRVLKDRNLGWNVQQISGTNAAAFVFKAERPAWHVLTDPSDRAGMERVRSLGGGDAKTLGIVVSPDLVSAPEAFTAGAPGMRVGFDDQALEGALSNTFIAAGFAVADRAQTAAIKRRGAEGGERFGNLSELGAAIRKLDGVDVVVHVNVDGVGPTRRLDARMFDVETGLAIGQESWPSLQAGRLAAYPVDGESPAEVGRFLAGRLMERWERQKSLARTIDVQVRNVGDAKEVVELASSLGGVPGVKSVVDMTIAAPVASFELVTQENPIVLLPYLAGAIGEWRPGTELGVDGRVIVVELAAAKTGGEPSAPAAVKPEPASPEPAAEPAPTRIVAPAPPMPAAAPTPDLAAAVARIRDGVCVVGLRHKDQFLPLGTGWVASENRVATNAHVVTALYEVSDLRVKRLGWNVADVRFVARRGPTMEHELQLGRTWIHPEYVEFLLKYRDGFIRDMLVRQGLDPESVEGKLARQQANFVTGYDVGLLEVKSGVIGSPIPIAPRETVMGLTPPAAVGYAGFPMENISSAPDKPVMATNIGWMSAVTRFDHQVGRGEDNMLLHYDLLTAGGASGSPVVDASGRVVAVNSAGSYVHLPAVTVERTGGGSGAKSAAPMQLPRIRTGFAYGQRSDLVLAMLGGVGSELNWGNVAPFLSKK